jgi:hypothetical protein
MQLFRYCAPTRDQADFSCTLGTCFTNPKEGNSSAHQRVAAQLLGDDAISLVKGFVFPQNVFDVSDRNVQEFVL